MRMLIFLLCMPLTLLAQNDLLSELEDEIVDEKQEVTSIFKGIKIINFESTKLVGENQLQFIISHRFGTLRNGIDSFLGLDDASVRIQFVYGVTDWLHISASRSGVGQTYDLAAKYHLIKQKNGGFPFTIAGYSIINVNTALDQNILPLLEFNDRLGYANQLLISRKFNDWVSLQLVPTIFHDNTVIEDNQDNTQYSIGFGGRFKLTKRFAILFDYALHLNREGSPLSSIDIINDFGLDFLTPNNRRNGQSQFNNPIGIGVEVETGGHVFQLHLSNTQAIFANGFLGQAGGDFSTGDIFFGFNLSRAFSIGKGKKKSKKVEDNTALTTNAIYR